MKKIISLVSVIFLVFMCNIAFAENTEFSGGTGTADDPYKVSSAEQLNAVRNYLDAYFIQTCDIDMTEATSEGGTYYNDGNGWVPIGDKNNIFTGTYNGGNYSIIGLYCADNSQYVGVFGYNAGNLRNMKAKDCHIEVTRFGGCIAGYNLGMVEYCSSNSLVTGNGTYAGGIVGYNVKGNIRYCSNFGNIKSSYSGGSVGGIVGSYDGDILSNCYNSGTIIGYGEVGGIAGSCCANINQCGNEGTIISYGKTSINQDSGGIVGFMSVNGTTLKQNVKDCFNKGIVGGGKYTADIVAYVYTSYSSSKVTIENCYTLNSLPKIFCDNYKNVNVVLENNYILDKDLTSEEMKDKEYFIGFDFDNVWGISNNVNEGLPYLRWLYDEAINDYIVNSLTVVNNNGETATDVFENCIARIRLTKNSIKNNNDCIILAMYDNYNEFLGITYMTINMNQRQEITVGMPIPNADTKKIKVFVWDNLSTMIPLSATHTYE